MKNILLPTDFSANSRNAIVYALHLYKEEVCEFTLLHSYEVDGYLEGSSLVPIPNAKSFSTKKELVENELKEFLGNLVEEHVNSNHRFRVFTGNLALTAFINKTVRSSNCDLVVIGTQGITSSANVAFGANTQRIIKKVTSCPILAIPSHVTFSKPKEIVLASGFKTVPRPEDYVFISNLVKQHNSQLKILFIDDGGGLSSGQDKNKELLMELLEDTPLSFHSLTHVPIPVGVYCFTESLSKVIFWL
ncbi:universal stress protein [Antarcticibacterium sp. 1MA-6-2]|uniref:universal stress protein n=1 Tax=Antarcticibacterium sp. 1MA-6-2 TaxID=2908210 RepID=UPI001F38AB62|nr:universal stress protein [Antarcticibacterium sp. 1MA-6-2]UJH90962.1 universal stress protein [Antarcticibacterium sp. 1MA-6-2]